MIFKIPLAWLQLKREKIRLLVAIIGIGFANFLMFMQLGFQEALFDSATRFHKSLNGDIFLISSQSTALLNMASFPQRRLYQTLAVEGVESVSPVYIGLGLWKSPETAIPHSILVVGFNPEVPLFNLPEVNQNLDKIKIQDIVLLDQDSRPEFGTKSIIKDFAQGKTISTEVSGRRIEVRDFFKLGTSFAANGNVITSDLNFLRIFGKRNASLIDIGVIKIKKGADTDKIVEILKQNIGNIYKDVLIFSKKDFIDFEKNYWQKTTTIGFIFALGTMMGFMVGTIIVYQILYTDVSDHLPEYATLKAMGYTDVYLLTVVFQEAVILAILGYTPGIAIASGFYNLTKNATNLPIAMTGNRAVLVLILTLIMCFISGAIAVRRLRAADPADIF